MQKLGLCVKNLNILAELSGRNEKLIRDLSFSVLPGETLSIVGESGCGKTMTALAIFGLLPDNCKAGGEILLNDINLLNLSKKKINDLRGNEIVYVPQSGADFLNPSIKVKTQIYESLKKNGIKGRDNLKLKAKELLIRVGLDNPEVILDKYAFQLSGGQAQRVVLAISLAGNPKLVIADEPTKGIDKETANKFLVALEELFKDAAKIIITHDISVASQNKNILVMGKGVLAEYGQSKDVLSNPKSDVTKNLLNSLPENLFKNARN